MDLEEYLLCRVLRRMPIPQQAKHERVDPVEVLLEERGERFGVAPADPRQIQYG